MITMVLLKYVLTVLGVVCAKAPLPIMMLELFVDSLIFLKVGRYQNLEKFQHILMSICLFYQELYDSTIFNH